MPMIPHGFFRGAPHQMGEAEVYPPGYVEAGLRVFRNLREGSVRYTIYWPKQRRTLATWCLSGPTWLREFWQWSEAIMSDRLKKVLKKMEGSGKPAAVKDPAFAKLYPTLWDFLTVTVIDGEARETATMNLFLHQGDLKSFLNDRQTRQSLCVTSDTVQGVFEALEAALASDNPGWRSLDSGPQSKPKKKT